MELRKLNKMQREIYLDYIENLVDISKLTTKDNSIMFNFKIDNNKCLNEITVIDQNGTKKEFDDLIFKCNEVFYDFFLPKLVKELYHNNNIVVSDIVNLDGDEFVAIRLITEFNDLFSIDGLTKDKAIELLDFIK